MNKFVLAIPLLNEKKNLNNLFNSLLKSHLKNDKKCKYIIFINDGSTDDTNLFLKNNIHKSKKFIKLKHKKNLGYGAALKTAIKFAKRKVTYIVFIDSDLTNPIIDIKKINIFMKKNVDFIQGNRYKKDLSGVDYNRRIIGTIGNYISRLLMNMKITDYTSGFRAVKLNFYFKINLIEDDFSIIMEEKYKLKRYIKTISEFPTKLSTRKSKIGKSSFNYSFKLILKYLYYCVASFFINNNYLKKID
jgi:glycosyltransferase involved in cell wall biosynthesis